MAQKLGTASWCRGGGEALTSITENESQAHHDICCICIRHALQLPSIFKWKSAKCRGEWNLWKKVFVYCSLLRGRDEWLSPFCWWNRLTLGWIELLCLSLCVFLFLLCNRRFLFISKVNCRVEETAQLVRRLLRKHEGLNSDLQYLCWCSTSYLWPKH